MLLIFESPVALKGNVGDQAIEEPKKVVDGNWGVHGVVKKALFAGRSDF